MNSFFLFFFLFLSFWGCTRHRGSKARSQIGAVAAGLHHSHTTQDPSRVCNLHHSSWQCQILKPLSEARDRTCILMDTSPVCYCRATTRTSFLAILFYFIFLVFGLFAFSRAAPLAYGGSQARGLIGAVTAGPHHSHSNVGSERCLPPTPQVRARPDR